MTIAHRYLEHDYKVASYRISIGGVLVTRFVSEDHSNAFARVATASIRIRASDIPATAVFHAPVTIEEGFDGLYQRVFTGKVLNVNPDEAGRAIECQGMSAPLDNPYHKVVITLDGSKTIEEWIEYLLDEAGIADYVVDMPAWTPGVTPLGYDDDGNPIYTTLEFQTYGEAITKLAEVDGGRWYETPTGTVRVDVKDPIPSLTAWRTYFSMRLAGLVETYPTGIATGRPRIRKIGATQKTREVKNQVWVRGAVMTSTNPDGSKASITIEGSASAPSPWVLKPDGGQAYNDLLFSNEIIDEAVKAGLTAGRLVAVENRLTTEIAVEIDGDPQVMLGLTVGLEDPDYSGLTGRWFVEGYRTTLDAGKYSTVLSLLGGPEAGGTINIAPFANFTYTVDYEVMGDREWAVVTFDASASVDPDGTITDYDFIDNQAPHVIDVNGTEPVQTVRFDPAVYTPPLEVTLTVTDDDGATDAITLTVLIEPGWAAVTVPSIYNANDTWFSASPDGGVTWNDQAAPGGDSVISVGAKSYDGLVSGIGVFGTNLGALYRTTDFCATAPALVMAACGFPIMDVKFSVTEAGVVWAVSRNGLLYRSPDDGATWALYDDLAAVFGLGDIYCKSISTPVPTGVWIFGGTGTGYPLIVWDAAYDHNWTGASIGGELEADLAISGYPVDLYVAGAGSRGAILAIILNSATHTPAVYSTADGFGDGSAWKRCLNLPAKSRGRWLAEDYDPYQFVFGYDDEVVYQGDVDPVTNVMTAAVAPAALDAGDAANYGLWLGAYVPGIGSCYIVAAEGVADGTLYKSWDRFGTIDKLRPAAGFPASPAGANAKMVAIGSAELPGGDLYAQESPLVNANYARRVAHLSTGAWSLQSDPVAATQDPVVKLQRLGSNLYRILALPSAFLTMAPGQLQRSPDNGINWSNVGPTPVVDSGDTWGVTDIDIGADGTLWLCCCCDPGGLGNNNLPPPAVYKSGDDGLNWGSAVYEDATQDTGYWRRFIDITAHPLNEQVVLVLGDRFPGIANTWTTENKGSNWTRRTGSLNQSVSGVRRAVMMDNGRVVAVMGSALAYTDDYGAIWTDSGESTSTYTYQLIRARNGQVVFHAGGSALSPEVKRSLGYGTTWETVLDDTGRPTVDRFWGLAYWFAGDALFASTEEQDGSDRVLMLAAASQATVGAVTDVTYNLGDVFTEGVGLAGVAV